MSDGPTTPLFIVGAPRSGTSLLRNLLRAFDDIYLPPDETQFIPAYLKLVADNPSTESLASFLESTPFSSHMRRRGIWPSRDKLVQIIEDTDPAIFMPKLMRCLSDREGGAAFSHWGDKTPGYIHFLDRFRLAFPNMRVLFIVRDPRDAALSMHDAWGRSLIHGATAWRDAAQIATRYLQSYGGDAARALHYESLVSDPAAILAPIADWIGVGFSADAIENYSGEEKWGAARGAGVVSSSIGRFRTRLSRKQIELVESISFDEMRAWGYEPEYATETYIPSTSRLRFARLIDRIRSVAAYVNERGIRGGLSYKISQYIVARRRRNG